MKHTGTPLPCALIAIRANKLYPCLFRPKAVSMSMHFWCMYFRALVRMVGVSCTGFEPSPALAASPCPQPGHAGLPAGHLHWIPRGARGSVLAPKDFQVPGPGGGGCHYGGASRQHPQTLSTDASAGVATALRHQDGRGWCTGASSLSGPAPSLAPGHNRLSGLGGNR